MSKSSRKHIVNSNKKLLKSLTIFFPFFNDEKTVSPQIQDAYFFGSALTDDLEVIAIHGGDSKDKTAREIQKNKKKYKSLIVIDKSDNTQGYAVIKEGFFRATKQWVFYTDGDRQYHLENLKDLVAVQKKDKVAVVNGYKIKRGDGIIRTFFGILYAKLTCMILNIQIRDPHCDFRLIKRSLISDFKPKSENAEIINELLLHLEKKHVSFSEVGIPHYPREYGKSNYSLLELLNQCIGGLMRLYIRKLH